MSPVISVNVPGRTHAGQKQTGTRPGTVGQAIPGVAVKLVHPETGAPALPGEPGLLLVKGPNRMLGYLNRAADTQAVFRDGWYVTGDIVTIDSEGFIRIVDRQSRFSKIGGEMVPHGKVEEALRSVLQGAPCVVTAVADERKGERLVAFSTASNLTPQDIWQALQSSALPKLWIPKAADIRFIDDLPVLGTGKIDLRAVKRLAAIA